MNHVHPYANGIENGQKHLETVALENLEFLDTLLKWNRENNISIFAIPHELFPRASDLYCGYRLDFATNALQRIGRTIVEKCQRVFGIMPEHLCELGAREETACVATMRALEMYTGILRHFPRDCLVIVTVPGSIHGTFEKKKVLARWMQRFNSLPMETRSRIALRNDQYYYSMADLLPLCRQLSVPLVWDTFAHERHSDMRGMNGLPNVEETWRMVNMKPVIFHAKDASPSEMPLFEGDVDVIVASETCEQSVLQFYEACELFVNPASLMNDIEKDETRSPPSALDDLP